MVRSPRPIAASALLFAAAIGASANGKFYANLEGGLPGVPYQRAILMFHEGKETLVLQSKFSLADRPLSEITLGWVVPVPSVPELESMKSEQASRFFRELDMLSRSSVIRIPIPLILAILGFTAYVFIWRLKKIRTIYFIYGIIFWLVVTWGALGSVFWPTGVEVIQEREVGVYRVKVIEATDSLDLIAWLNEGGFQFHTSDLPILSDYIKRGWVFVVANVKAEDKTKVLDSYTGMPDPLILSFSSEFPVYPLALTGSAGSATNVLLYVLCHKRVQCSSALELKFAGRIEKVPLEFPSMAWETSLTFLCKFEGTMTPTQMRRDLEFEFVTNDAPYRERSVYWW